MLADLSLSFVSGAVLGALLLCLGLLIGIYLGRRAQTAETGPVTAQQLLQVVASLNRWAASFASDVQAHRKRIDTLALQAQRGESPGNPVTAQTLIDEAQTANEFLERRLAAAEKNLQEQAIQLEGYMAEARTDGLTKLPNRRALDAELAARVARWRREGKPFAVLMVDVDHFKKLNDVHGHLVGDQVLQRVADILKTAGTDADFVGRYGGEEFCVLLPSPDIDAARCLATRLRRNVSDAEFIHDGQSLLVTISCGGAATQLGDDTALLVKRADAALYAAKQAGRNRSYWHDGRQIALLERLGDEPLASATANAPAPTSIGFNDVVADLQKKLQQVTRHS